MSLLHEFKLRSTLLTYTPREYKKGQILFHAEDEPDSIIYMQRGRVKKYRINEDGNEIIVDTYTAHSLFPLSVLVHVKESGYFYEAMDTIKVRIIPIEDMEALFRKYPNFVFSLFSYTQESLQKLSRKMYHAIGSTAYTRLLYELIEECRNAVPDTTTKEYVLSLHEYQLASQAGLSRETASRELRKLKEQEWITVERKFIVVKNLPKLRKEYEETV